jgi:hypothetical protein
MTGILFGLHIFTLGLVGSKVCVGFSAPPRWRSLLVSSCGVFEANRRVYAAFLETFPGWREYVNQLVQLNPQSHNHATCMAPFYGTRTAAEATTLEKLCSLQPCGTLMWPMYWQTSVQVIGAISLILFECTYKISPLAGVKLDTEEKKSEILLRISRLG